MFKNIWEKIKKLAKILTWVGIFLGVIYGVVIGIAIEKQENSAIVGLIVGILVAGIVALSAWIGNFILYGFGELIENSVYNRKINEELLGVMSAYTKSRKVQIQEQNKTKIKENVSNGCSDEWHKYYFCQSGRVGNDTQDGYWDNDISGKKVFVCKHCNNVIGYESDFEK